VFGTDYPAPMRLEDPVRLIEGLESLGAAEHEQLLRGTAARIFDSK